MKNILLIIVTAVVLFGVSAAISLYLQNPAALRGPDKDKDGAKADDKEKEKDAARRKGEDTTPIAPPPPSTPSEQVTRLLARLQEREGELKRREEDVRKQETRLEILLEDIKAERSVLDGLRKRFDDELKRLNDKDATIATKAKGLDEQKAAAKKLLDEMRKRQVDLEKGESGNITRMASLMDSMDSDKGAAIIRQLAEGGQKDTAVKVLGLMKDRKAAQLLAAMTDVQLAAELLEKLRGLRRANGAAAAKGEG